jgi:hypothetical protein
MVICKYPEARGSGKISWCEKVDSAKNTRKIGINPLISANYRLRYLKPMNLKSSITATHETKPEAKKTAETEFSSLQHLHGMEINLHQKKHTQQHPWNRVVWGKTHQATLLISVVVLTLTISIE